MLINLGGRKFWLVVVALLISVINSVLGLGISEATIQAILIAAVAGGGTIALEDGLRAAFAAKKHDNAVDFLSEMLSDSVNENADVDDLLEDDETEDDNESE